MPYNMKHQILFITTEHNIILEQLLFLTYKSLYKNINRNKQSSN